MKKGAGWAMGGVGLALGLLIGFIVGADNVRPNPAERELDADLWVQTAAEYHALCLQTFRHARECLERRMAAPPPGEKPFAVVMDLDETVFDNSAYQGWLYNNATTHHRDLWAIWAQDHADEVKLVPGAREFIQHAEQRNVEVFYISNRLKKHEKGTLEALRHLQLATPGVEKRLLLRDGESDKEPRRQEVERGHRVLLFIGDNLGDLSSIFFPGDNAPDTFEAQTNVIVARRKKVDDFRQRFGHDWIILPNPMYGDWKTPLGAQPARHLRSTNLKRP